MKKYRLLWTGGWDSSFRLCQLSRIEGADVQPVYIHHPQRPSSGLEQQAMSKILKAVRLKKETKALIRDVEIVEYFSISVPGYIDEAYERLCQRFPKLGGQYRWIAAYAALYPGIELGEEHYYSVPGTLYSIFNAAGGLKFDENGYGYLPSDIADTDIAAIFSNYSYPIARYREVDMRQLIEEWHYEDIMRHIWFCQQLLNDKPCGVCVPCRLKMRAGMAHLLSAAAKRNFKIFSYIQECGKVDVREFGHYLNGSLHQRLKIFRNLENRCDSKGKAELSINKTKLLAEISYFDSLMRDFR